MSTPESKPAVTLDQLIALNDEIASLVRAGVPLERGLSDLGQDLPGRLGKFAAKLAEQTGRGESLVDALSDSGARLPRVYRSVVEAGVRAGRLPAALESLAGSMRRLAETRRGVILALLYPLLLIMIAWGMFALFTAYIAPELLGTFKELGVRSAAIFEPLVWCGRGAKYWGPVGPAVLLVLAALWWRAATQAAVVGSRRAMVLFGWLPWLHRTLRWSHTAVFVEILAMLVENRVPLDEALRLAGESSGDSSLAGAAENLADTIRRGGNVAGTRRVPSADAEKNPAGTGLPDITADGTRRVPATLPPLLQWLILGGRNQAAFLPALRHAAENYHTQAQLQAELARTWLPILVTLFVSSAITLLYTLSLFVPYASMLKELARP